jgi:hypothetical protein
MLNYPLYYLKLYIRIHNRKHHNTFYFILKRFHLSIKTTIISHQLFHILSFFLYIYFKNSLRTLKISKSIQTPHKTWTRDVCHTVNLPLILKSILRQKKNYGNSNISPCKKYNLQKNPLKENKILQDIQNSITKSHVSTQSQNIIFQKSSYKNRPTTWGQNPSSYYTL